MPVYFIRSGDIGPVKIGWARDVEARRKQLQVSHPYPLYVLRVIECRRGTEQWLQKRYEAAKLLGEWFAFDAEMLTIEPPDLATRMKPKPREKVAAIPELHQRSPRAIEEWRQIQLDVLVHLYDRAMDRWNRRRNGR